MPLMQPRRCFLFEKCPATGFEQATLSMSSVIRRRLWAVKVVVSLLWLMGGFLFHCGFSVAAASETPPVEEKTLAEKVDEVLDEAAEATDKAHERLSDRVTETAKWVDSFFYDERFRDEDNNTRLILKFSSFFEKDESTEYKLRAKLRLVMPYTENKLLLLVSGDGDEGLGFAGTGSNVDDITGSDSDDVNVGLRYFFKSIKSRNISGTINFRYRNSTLVSIPEARWRETIPLEPWVTRLTQRFRWYSDEGWESKSTVDFDREFSPQWFFRTTAEGKWSEEEEHEKGFMYGFNFSLIQTLSKDHAMIYEILNSFETKPTNQLATTIVKATYRRQIWRKWLFMELAPQIVFDEEDDYEWKPGFTVMFEGIFGNMPVLGSDSNK